MQKKHIACPSFDLRTQSLFSTIVRTIQVAKRFEGQDVVFFVGSMGAGKSLLIQRLLGHTAARKIWHNQRLYTLTEWGNRRERGAKWVYDVETSVGPTVGHATLAQTNDVKGFFCKDLGCILADTAGGFDNTDKLGGLGTMLAMKYAKSVRLVYCSRYDTELDQRYGVNKSTALLANVSQVFHLLLSGTHQTFTQSCFDSVLFVGSHMNGDSLADLNCEMANLLDDHQRYDGEQLGVAREQTDLLAFLNRANQTYMASFDPEDEASLAVLRQKISELTPMTLDRSRLKIPLPEYSIRELETVLGNPAHTALLQRGYVCKKELKIAQEAYDTAKIGYDQWQSTWDHLTAQLHAFEAKLPAGVTGETLEAYVTDLQEKARALKSRFKQKKRDKTCSDPLYQAYLQKAKTDYDQACASLQNTITKIEKKRAEWLRIVDDRDTLYAQGKPHIETLARCTAELDTAKAAEGVLDRQIQREIRPLYSFLLSVNELVAGFGQFSSVNAFLQACKDYELTALAQNPLSLDRKTPYALLTDRMVGTPFPTPLHATVAFDRLGLRRVSASGAPMARFLGCLAQCMTGDYESELALDMATARRWYGGDADMPPVQTLYFQLKACFLDYPCETDSVVGLTHMVDRVQNTLKCLIPPIHVFFEATGQLMSLSPCVSDDGVVITCHDEGDFACLRFVDAAKDASLDSHCRDLVRLMETHGEISRLVDQWGGRGDGDSLQATFDRQIVALAECATLKDISRLVVPDQSCCGFQRLLALESHMVGPIHQEIVKTLSKKLALVLHDRLEAYFDQRYKEDQQKKALLEEQRRDIATLLTDTEKKRQEIANKLSDSHEIENLHSSAYASDLMGAIYTAGKQVAHISKDSVQTITQGLSLKTPKPNDVSETALYDYLNAVLEAVSATTTTIDRTRLADVAIPGLEVTKLPDTYTVHGSFCVRMSDILQAATAWKTDQEKELWQSLQAQVKDSTQRLCVWRDKPIPFFQHVFTLTIKAPVIYLDTDSVWRGGHLVLDAAHIVVPEGRHVLVDVSGQDAAAYPEIQTLAGTNKPNPKDGDDGAHGKDGQDAGSLTLLATCFSGYQRVSFRLNGGNGTEGQSGGPGKDGSPGENGKPGAIDAEIAKLSTLERVKDAFSVGSAHIAKGGEVNAASFRGERGGNGGKNGCGGKGGRAGVLTLKILKDAPVIWPSHIQQEPGKDGRDGTPGPGGDGGWDGVPGMSIGRERTLLCIRWGDDILGAVLAYNDKSTWWKHDIRVTRDIRVAIVERDFQRCITSQKGTTSAQETRLSGHMTQSGVSQVRTGSAVTRWRHPSLHSQGTLDALREIQLGYDNTIATYKDKKAQLDAASTALNQGMADMLTASLRHTDKRNAMNQMFHVVTTQQTVTQLKIAPPPRKKSEVFNKYKPRFVGVLSSRGGGRAKAVMETTQGVVGSLVSVVSAPVVGVLGTMHTRFIGDKVLTSPKQIDLSQLREPYLTLMQQLLEDVRQAAYTPALKRVLYTAVDVVVKEAMSQLGTAEYAWKHVVLPLKQDCQELACLSSDNPKWDRPALLKSLFELRYANPTEFQEKFQTMQHAFGLASCVADDSVNVFVLEKAYRIKLAHVSAFSDKEMAALDAFVSTYQVLQEIQSKEIEKIKWLEQIALNYTAGYTLPEITRSLCGTTLPKYIWDMGADIMVLHQIDHRFSQIVFRHSELVEWVKYLDEAASDLAQEPARRALYASLITQTHRRIQTQLYVPLQKRCLETFGLFLEAICEDMMGDIPFGLSERVGMFQVVYTLLTSSDKEDLFEDTLRRSMVNALTTFDNESSLDLSLRQTLARTPMADRLVVLIRHTKGRPLTDLSPRLLKKIDLLLCYGAVLSDEDRDAIEEMVDSLC